MYNKSNSRIIIIGGSGLIGSSLNSYLLKKDFKVIATYANNFSDSIVATELLTPADIEQRFNIKGGHWHQGDMGIDQLFMMRPVHGAAQYETPLNGLFLCGASAHPGGGITGVPGHNAAQRIIWGVVK